jgi:hypothetical protein
MFKMVTVYYLNSSRFSNSFLYFETFLALNQAKWIFLIDKNYKLSLYSFTR